MTTRYNSKMRNYFTLVPDGPTMPLEGGLVGQPVTPKCCRCGKILGSRSSEMDHMMEHVADDVWAIREMVEVMTS